VAIELGANQYGKAESRVVRIYRDTERHEIRDLNVTTALRGDFAAAHTEGDQASVLPTDTQKNTVYAFARSHGIGAVEDYALALARHFVDDVAPVTAARVQVDEYAWDRIEVDGREHNHSFVRRNQEIRTTHVSVTGALDDQRVHVVSGLRDLVVLKSTGSEFAGFLTDEYTTLQPTHDRVMATSLIARWRYDPGVGAPGAWDETYAAVRGTLLATYATVHSLALQQTLYAMGAAVLEQQSAISEIRLSAPNLHHFVVDLSPFGLDNPGEVFHADDRPYGLIQASVRREAAEPAHEAWQTSEGFV
jgi:urate oxidase